MLNCVKKSLPYPLFCAATVFAGCVGAEHNLGIRHMNNGATSKMMATSAPSATTIGVGRPPKVALATLATAALLSQVVLADQSAYPPLYMEPGYQRESDASAQGIFLGTIDNMGTFELQQHLQRIIDEARTNLRLNKRHLQDRLRLSGLGDRRCDYSWLLTAVYGEGCRTACKEWLDRSHSIVSPVAQQHNRKIMDFYTHKPISNATCFPNELERKSRTGDCYGWRELVVDSDGQEHVVYKSPPQVLMQIAHAAGGDPIKEAQLLNETALLILSKEEELRKLWCESYDKQDMALGLARSAYMFLKHAQDLTTFAKLENVTNKLVENEKLAKLAQKGERCDQQKREAQKQKRHAHRKHGRRQQKHGFSGNRF